MAEMETCAQSLLLYKCLLNTSAIYILTNTLFSLVFPNT